MTNLEELNGKVWYRLLKVIYILFYLPIVVLLFVVITEMGREYKAPILPATVQEALKDPEFYKLNQSEMVKVIALIDSNFSFYSLDNKTLDLKNEDVPKSNSLDSFEKHLHEKYKGEKLLIQYIQKQPRPTIPLKQKYVYESFWSWNVVKCILSGFIVIICYVLIMEFFRRCFYYIAIGKVFPKQ